MDSSLQSPEKPLPQTFEYKENSKRNHPNHLPKFKVHWNQAQKPPKISTNHKLVKLYGFKPLKARRTFTTNLRRRRTHDEREEQRISNKLIARDSL